MRSPSHTQPAKTVGIVVALTRTGDSRGGPRPPRGCGSSHFAVPFSLQSRCCKVSAAWILTSVFPVRCPQVAHRQRVLARERPEKGTGLLNGPGRAATLLHTSPSCWALGHAHVFLCRTFTSAGRLLLSPLLQHYQRPEGGSHGCLLHLTPSGRAPWQARC